MKRDDEHDMSTSFQFSLSIFGPKIIQFIYHIANWFVSKQSTAARRSLALAVVLTGLSESQKKPLLGTRIIIRITAYSAGVP